MEFEKESALIEAILFLESEPVTEKSLSAISELSEEVVRKSLEVLKEKYKSDASGIELEMITGGWALIPKKEIWNVLKERYGNKNEGKLSRSAMETLSIIAYSQPVTRAEIESIRGVSADNMIRLLMERNLIKEVDKKDIPGKPSLYGTTKEFLKFFRLNSIADLPKLDEAEDKEKQEELYHWAKLIAADRWEDVCMEAKGNPYRELVKDELEKIRQDETERWLYLREEMALMDERCRLNTAKRQGLAEGRSEMKQLTQKLLQDNRIEDLQKAFEDEAYLQKLMEEYRIE